jgi:hypothetical protein
LKPAGAGNCQGVDTGSPALFIGHGLDLGLEVGQHGGALLKMMLEMGIRPPVFIPDRGIFQCGAQFLQFVVIV